MSLNKLFGQIFWKNWKLFEKKIEKLEEKKFEKMKEKKKFLEKFEKLKSLLKNELEFNTRRRCLKRESARFSIYSSSLIVGQ